MTSAEVATLAGISVARVRKLCEQGRFPGAQRMGSVRRGLWVIPRADVVRWVEADRDRRRKGKMTVSI